MKKMIIVNGAMGVGKTSVCKELNKRLPNSAWLDSDWCMMINPLDFSDIDKKLFLDNVHHLLNNYLSNPRVQSIIFSWVIPREEMIGYIIKNLSAHSFHTIRITLLCEDAKLRERMLHAGWDEATIQKSISYQQTFRSSDIEKIDTTDLSVLATVNTVLERERMIVC